MNDNYASDFEEAMRLMFQTHTTYSIGLKGHYKLIINKELIIYVFQSTTTTYVKLNINRENFYIKLYTSGNGDDWLEIDNEFEYGTVDLSNNGDRWEGYCLNSNPCGFGIQYDDNNTLVYRGFVFDSKKVCFGEEYYDNGMIRYRGTYINGNRHGYGCLYDIRGELIYGGNWLYNENEGFRLNLNIHTDYIDDKLIHNLVHELKIGYICYNDLKELILNDYPNLTIFAVGSDSFSKIESFELTNNNKLEILTIGNKSMKNVKSCQFCSM